MSAYQPNSGSKLSQRRSPLLVQCRQMLLRCWPNTTSTPDLLYTKWQHPSKFTQYCFNIGPMYLTLACHRNSIRSLSRVCWDWHFYAVMLYSSRRQKSHLGHGLEPPTMHPPPSPHTHISPTPTFFLSVDMSKT